MISLSCFHLFFFISEGLAAPVLNFLVSICGAAGAMLSGRSPPSLSLSEKNKTKKSHQNQTEKNTAEAFLSICWVSTPAAIGFFNPCSPHAALPSAAVRELGLWHPGD